MSAADVSELDAQIAGLLAQLTAASTNEDTQEFLRISREIEALHAERDARVIQVSEASP